MSGMNVTRRFKLACCSLLVLLFGGTTAFSQRKPAPADQIKLAERFFAQEAECRALLRREQWKQAEAACKAATQLADRFTDHRELEKMGAYGSVSQALMGQERYQDAIKQYVRALELSRPRLTDANAEVGELYARIGMAYHSLRDLNAAREWYGKAEKTYLTAYSNIKEEDVVEEGLEIKRGYLRTLKNIFERHLMAAHEAGATAEAEEIKKRVANLP